MGVLAYTLLSCLSLTAAALDHSFDKTKVLAAVKPANYHSQLYPCPAACLNKPSSNWTVYSSIESIETCSEPLLLDFSIFNPITDKRSSHLVRACTLTNPNTTVNALLPEDPSGLRRVVRREDPTTKPLLELPECLRNGNATTAAIRISSKSTRQAVDKVELLALLDHVREELQRKASCDRSALFATYRNTMLGVFAGTSVGKASVLSALPPLEDYIASSSKSSIITAQLCGRGRGGANTLGVVADLTGNITTVQTAVRNWVLGKCAEAAGSSKAQKIPVDIWEFAGPAQNQRVDDISSSKSLDRRAPREFNLQKRDDCRFIIVGGNDNCGTLSQRCGNAPLEFMSYNKADNFCNTLKVGQSVCCSSGTRPQSFDGTCTTATVSPGDGCSHLLKKCGIDAFEFLADNTQKDVCNTLQAGQRVCCSKGSMPPLPDGSCRVAVAGPNDTCGSLSQKCGNAPLEFMSYNTQSGLCDNIKAGTRVCCSKGRLPTNDCTTTIVGSGDGSCSAVAQRCGVNVYDFQLYNPQDNFCTTMAVGQKVCCSSGRVPRPKPQADGTCATHLVQAMDTCSALAASNGLTVDELISFNEKTVWGWSGCEPNLFLAGLNICLSEGDAPLPAPYANAVCGPVKPNTSKPPKGTSLADLNPCPLNACCNVWGQCGMSSDFCTVFKSPKGAPGWSPPGGNACISNCGTEIVNKDTPPSDGFKHIGYWESWNLDRPCLRMDVKTAAAQGGYTHIHWAFMGIDTRTWTPIVNNSRNQWSDFKSLTNVKKIVSFGGWTFSTAPDTYQILRQAVSSANRELFATNVAAFVRNEGLDGVDFDWEYPGATDIPGTPGGSPDEGYNYLVFLSTVKSKLASGKSLSIAAPSSFWYLRSFPLTYLNLVLDYIVYMTYDLHGQWDAGNKWSVEGCPAGNCLRSHVNLTETMRALTMITKAGIPTNKIFVGEASYGRSFHMAQGGCGGPDCPFTGDSEHSDAQKGKCTDTAGYIALAEIDALQLTAKNVFKWHDGASNSDIMVWDNNQWVAYMSETTKSTRRDLWKKYNFAGTVEWAMDLRGTGYDGILPDLANNDDSFDEEDWNYIWPRGKGLYADCILLYNDFDKIEANLAGIPPYCLELHVTQALQESVRASLRGFDLLMQTDYDTKFETYSAAVADRAADSVRDFMADKANDYFTCKLRTGSYCCEKCQSAELRTSPGCKNCFNDGECCTSEAPRKLKREDTRRDGPCGFDYLVTRWTDIEGPCPPKNPQDTRQTVTYIMKSGKSDAFYADLFKATGIPKENIAWKDYARYDDCRGRPLEVCQRRDWSFNFPYPINWSKASIENPKTTVQKAAEKLATWPQQLADVVSAAQAGTYDGLLDQLNDAVSTNILMLADAVQSMKQVSDAAVEIVKQEKEKVFEAIMLFLTAILIIIPVAGEIAVPARLASMARWFRAGGAAGNTAMDIYSVVEDPSNAPFLIFGLLGGAGGLTDFAKVGRASKLRRAMGDKIDKLGTAGAKIKQIQTIRTKPRVCGLSKRDLGLEEWPAVLLNNQTMASLGRGV